MQYNKNEAIVNQMFFTIMDKYEGVNGDCRVVGDILRKNLYILDEMSPKELSASFEFLAKPLNDKPVKFSDTVIAAFGPTNGAKINIQLDIQDQKSLNQKTHILSNLGSTLEKLRNNPDKDTKKE